MNMCAAPHISLACLQSYTAVPRFADTRSPPATVFSYNLKSKYCYMSSDPVWTAVLKGTSSDHVDSGCVNGAVKYCSKHPGPSLLPTWTAPQPDPKKKLGRLQHSKDLVQSTGAPREQNPWQL